MLEDLAADLGNCNFQRDLIIAIDRQQVDDLRDLSILGEDVCVTIVALRSNVACGRFTALEESLGEVDGACRIERRAHGACQDDVVGDDFDIDFGIGNEAAQV
ncbi:hypothetical protein D9M72_586050 [compost metagenome]